MSATDSPPAPCLTPPVAEAERDRIARRLAEIACEAGEILRGFHGGHCPHEFKADGSPASLADARSEALILERLAQAWPGIPVVAEETCSDAAPAALFFLVDPLDGTRDFLAGNPEYSVNICLVCGERPIASALAAPGLHRVWYAGVRAFEAPVEDGRPGAARAIAVRKPGADGLVALVSRLHGDSETDACLSRLPIRERRVASSAVKFGLIAAGEADIYVRCVPTMEWDTAAGDHIVTAAGGCTLVHGGAGMTYGRHARAYRNGPFVALGDRSYAEGLDVPERSSVAYREKRRAAAGA